MKARTPKYEKETWGGDEWKGEPDRKEWRDEATGMQCLALRNHLGSWCGYVGVVPSHPAHGLHYDGAENVAAEKYSKATRKRMNIALKLKDGGASFTEAMAKAWEGAPEEPELGLAGPALRGVTVHGGLTYAGENNGYIGSEAAPDLWWFGFDTAHSGDFVPGLMGTLTSASYRATFRNEAYRNLAYVEKKNVHHLHRSYTR